MAGTDGELLRESTGIGGAGCRLAAVVRGMHIRPASASDAPSLASLASELGYPAGPQAVSRRLALLAQPDHAVFVAEAGGEAIGFVHVHARRLLVAEPFAELGGLVVSSGARRQGAGSALLRAARDWARAGHLSPLRIRANMLRDEAHPFYTSQGCRHAKDQHVYEVEP